MTHDPEELEPSGDPRLAGLLRGLNDDDFARTDAPAVYSPRSQAA